MALRRAAAGRAAQAAADAHMKNDPMYPINLLNKFREAYGSKGANQETQANEMPSSIPGIMSHQEPNQNENEGMSPQLNTNAVSEMNGQSNKPESINGIPLEYIMQAITAKALGLPAPKMGETPEEKQAAALDLFKQKEQFKGQQVQQQLEDKEKIAIKKDLPTLEKSLKSVNELMDIAKQNPDIFGHGLLPDIYAKTSKNKDFGKWQNLIADAIVGLEQKLSSRGNVVALKIAGQLKPSHSDQQNVAIGKIESMQKQLIDSINRSRGSLGMPPYSPYKDDDMVIVEGPNGDETMTYAKAKKLGAM